MDLGSTLVLPLSATDRNGDAVSFSASPLPLPANATLDAASGEFRFAPDEAQAGDIPLTFLASDGQLAGSEPVTITVVAPAPTDPTRLQGRVLDANDAALEPRVETPLEGVTVRDVDAGLSTTTDANGSFSLEGIPGGMRTIEYDASTITTPAPPPQYGSYVGNPVVIANATNVLDRDIFLPRIDPNGDGTVGQGGGTVTNAPSE